MLGCFSRSPTKNSAANGPHTSQAGILLVLQVASEADPGPLFPSPLPRSRPDTTCVSSNPLKSRRCAGQLLQECQGKIMGRTRNGQGEAWPDTCERRWGQGQWTVG